MEDVLFEILFLMVVVKNLLGCFMFVILVGMFFGFDVK